MGMNWPPGMQNDSLRQQSIEMRARKKDPDARWRRVIADLFAYAMMLLFVVFVGALIYVFVQIP